MQRINPGAGTKQCFGANYRIKPPVISLLNFPFVGQTKYFDKPMRWPFLFLAPLSTGATGGMKQLTKYCLDPKPLSQRGALLSSTVRWVELYHEPGAVAARLRRLHLIIVDLCHPRKTVTKIERKFHRQITCVRHTSVVSITPMPLWGNEAWRCRCVFGYSLDDSDKPVFLIWPERTESNVFL